MNKREINIALISIGISFTIASILNIAINNYLFKKYLLDFDFFNKATIIPLIFMSLGMSIIITLFYFEDKYLKSHLKLKYLYLIGIAFTPIYFYLSFMMYLIGIIICILFNISDKFSHLIFIIHLETITLFLFIEYIFLKKIEEGKSIYPKELENILPKEQPNA